MRNIIFIFIACFSQMVLAQKQPCIDQHNLTVDADKKAAIAKECPTLKGAQLATCVSKAGIAKRFTKRGSIPFSEATYAKLTEKDASKKALELEALQKQCRSNVFARELVAGELFAEDIQREISWLETHKLAGVRRYQLN